MTPPTPHSMKHVLQDVVIIEAIMVITDTIADVSSKVMMMITVITKMKMAMTDITKVNMTIMRMITGITETII